MGKFKFQQTTRTQGKSNHKGKMGAYPLQKSDNCIDGSLKIQFFTNLKLHCQKANSTPEQTIGKSMNILCTTHFMHNFDELERITTIPVHQSSNLKVPILVNDIKSSNHLIAINNKTSSLFFFFLFFLNIIRPHKKHNKKFQTKNVKNKATPNFPHKKLTPLA